MKLLTFTKNGRTSYGPKVKREDAVWDVLKIAEARNVQVPASIREGVAKGNEFVEEVRALVDEMGASEEAEHFKYPFQEVTWEAPIPRPPKNVICVGKNYADHAAEMGAATPPEHVLVFTKSPTSIAADNEELPTHHAKTSSLDYEGELAVIIGKEGKDIPKQLAYDYIFGYTIANDVTARDVQKAHGQFFLGKSLEGTCPMGPYVVSKDEIPNPHNLTVVTKVNEEVRQNGHTSQMMFKVDDLIAQISKYVTLEPGDIILTGTPAGVGKGMNPPQYLKSGDVVKVSIEGIGTLTNTFRDK